MTDLPKPVTRDQTFLRAIVDRLDRQNELLVDLRDRLPADRGQPAAKEPAAERAAVVELTEPAAPKSRPVAASKPAKPAKATAKPAKATATTTAKPAAKTAARPSRSPRTKRPSTTKESS